MSGFILVTIALLLFAISVWQYKLNTEESDFKPILCLVLASIFIIACMLVNEEVINDGLNGKGQEIVIVKVQNFNESKINEFRLKYMEGEITHYPSVNEYVEITYFEDFFDYKYITDIKPIEIIYKGEK